MSDIEKRSREWGIPPRVIATAQRPRPTDAINYASEFMQRYQSGESNIMVLAGGVGVGKTVAAAWLMMQLPPNQHGSYGVRRFRHISEICEVGLYGDAEERAERQTVKRSQVLVLDDVGTEHLTDTFRTLFDGLMNARYEDTGATIITTNLPSEKFLERYGQRIYDRLCGRGEWYEIAHESLRRKS